MQGVSLSSYLENILRNTVGMKMKLPDQKQSADNPIMEELDQLLKNKLSKEESKKKTDDYFRRKPYMKEVIAHLEEKHGR